MEEAKAYKKYAAALIPGESKRIGGNKGIIRKGERAALEAERQAEIEQMSRELLNQQRMEDIKESAREEVKRQARIRGNRGDEISTTAAEVEGEKMEDEYIKSKTSLLEGKVITALPPVPKPKKDWIEREQYIHEIEAARKRGYMDKDPMGLNYGDRIELAYGAKDLEEHANSAINDSGINIETLRDFLRRIMPKAKPMQIEKILRTNINDALISYSLGIANVKNAAPSFLQGIAARGMNITQACKFGKSKKLYKSIKIPKALFGVRAINPPSPAIFVMRFMSFVWRLLGSGINRPPGSFLRIGMAFMKNLGDGDKVVQNARGKYVMLPFTKPMLVKALMKLDSIAPGLVGAYAAYQIDSVEIKKLRSAEREKNREIREKNLALYNSVVGDISEALDAFSGTLATAANLLLPGVGRKATEENIAPLLTSYTDGPKKGTVLKPGEYRRAIFAASAKGQTFARDTYKKEAE